MKKVTLLAISLLCAIFATAQEWPAIQPEAHPATRWWWLGNAVDKSNLTYLLEQYSKAGIGGVEITPIYGVQGNDAKEIQFLSPQWMQMLRHVQSEGKRLSVETDMNTGTGWPFGGPTVSTEDAATKAIFQEYTLHEGENLTLIIEPQNERQKPVATLSRLMAFSDNGQVENLTNKVKNKKLNWTAPKGNWRIIALFNGKTLQQVKRAAPGGEGLVMDHFSSKAVKSYLSRFENAFKTTQTPYPHTFFNDSYEVYGADWTPELLEEFYRRRGYKLENYFPQFLDTTRTETTARIISDYRETLSDMLKKNFTEQWTNWAHKHGSETRNQAHGSPGNLIDLYATVDIPECEGFGLSQFHIKGLRQDSLTRRNDSDLSMMKYASSAAHISGKKYTSSETLTWLTEHFRTSLSQCKPDIDLLFSSGINHIFFHGTPYSPQEAEWPGWLFYASVNMSPTNTIWHDAPVFFDYITRCQSFLQLGKPDNDFLLYLPIYDIWQEQKGRYLSFEINHMDERAPKFINVVNEINKCGYDVDYISDNFIRMTQVKNGQLTTPGGAQYKALIIPATHLIPEDVLQHLLQLAKEGADIVFLENYPSDVPGYGNLEKRRKAFNTIASQLPKVSFSKTTSSDYQKGKIITGSDYEETLAKCNATPEEIKYLYGMHSIRRAEANGYIYFVSSLQDKDMDNWVTLGKNAAQVALYDPLTGKRGMAKTRVQNGKTQIYLQLRSGESTIIRTYNEQQPQSSELHQWNYYTEEPISISLDHGWTLRFIESEPKIEGTFNIDKPVSWTTLDNADTKRNSGTALYSVNVTLPSIHADDWILDLGDVRESAKVRINGAEVGTCWAVSFRLNVGKFLKEGANLIEIEVTNLPANRIADYDRRGIKWRIFKEINLVDLNYEKTGYGHWQTMPSGLNSAVKLIPVKRID